MKIKNVKFFDAVRVNQKMTNYFEGGTADFTLRTWQIKQTDGSLRIVPFENCVEFTAIEEPVNEGSRDTQSVPVKGKGQQK